MFSTLRSVVTFAVLIPASLMTQSAFAQRNRWEGGNQSGVRTVFQLNPNGEWTEQVGGSVAATTHRFALRSNQPDYIMLFDANRDVNVVLYEDRLDIWNAATGNWEPLYSGRWIRNIPAPLPSAARTLQIRFTELLILDDKEGGSGDWNLVGSIGDQGERTLISSQEGGTGASIGIRSAWTQVVGPVTVSATVQEYDGGFDSDWAYVGRKELRVSQPGTYTLQIENREGRVRVTFVVQ